MAAAKVIISPRLAKRCARVKDQPARRSIGHHYGTQDSNLAPFAV
jgi:hypothetical protein